MIVFEHCGRQHILMPRSNDRKLYFMWHFPTRELAQAEIKVMLALWTIEPEQRLDYMLFSFVKSLDAVRAEPEFATK
jgi:hypothetical protein